MTAESLEFVAVGARVKAARLVVSITEKRPYSCGFCRTADFMLEYNLLFGPRWPQPIDNA
jgi:hypothetical protein